ncbi:MAG: metal-dependent hydrolase [Gammaproteobacteria bacterium]|nr:metal-dependent hydrolase [Gammaproteobacteria bacterium]MBQ0774263.1 metal-dependent hydrolase [Gammaproteobacteria bacterium]
MPTQRNLHFRLDPEKIANWNKDSAHVSHFMNTLSLFFPVGERFFIDSVRHYRDSITDPELKKAVKAFIGQEAMHGREHEEYNGAMFAKVPATRGMERFVESLLNQVKKLPKGWQLSATIALEHFTAILADALLTEPRILEDADSRYALLWRGHALEETEHKAVAFDVWEAVKGTDPLAYVERTAGLLLASLIFWSIAIPFYLRVLYHEKQLTNLKGWAKLFHYAFGKVGTLRKLIGPWADYFRPSFHPWDHDNRELLDQLEVLAREVEAA